MTTATVLQHLNILSLDDWAQTSIEGTEWANGTLLEKTGRTLKHSLVQLKLGRYWANYAESSGQGGETYTEAPCRTNQQGRSPDVAYLTPELLAQFGSATVLPQSFPLIAEIISPTDSAEDVIGKAQEYLQSGSVEVWLVFPENRWVIVVTQSAKRIFTSGEQVSTQAVLSGFTVAVDDLLS